MSSSSSFFLIRLAAAIIIGFFLGVWSQFPDHLSSLYGIHLRSVTSFDYRTTPPSSSVPSPESQPRRPSFPYGCGDGCRKLHTFLREKDPVSNKTRIAVLVGNDHYQMFVPPENTGYDGIGNHVNTFGASLAQLEIPFIAVVPHRDVRPPLPFEVRETPKGAGFKEAAIPILRDIQSEYDVIVMFSQSDWAHVFSQFSRINIITFHDSLFLNQHIDPNPKIFYRFISHNQLKRFVPNKNDHHRVIYHGIVEEEFMKCPDGNYVLFVAGLAWGEHKGIKQVFHMATAHPNIQFHVYGGGFGDAVQRTMSMITGFASQHSNFHWLGELKRDRHKQVFCEASLFVMPTLVPEAFGLVAIEAMSKGVPVLGSTEGAIPEVLGGHGIICSPSEMDCWSSHLRDALALRENRSDEIRNFTHASYHHFVQANNLLDYAYYALINQGIMEESPLS